MAGPAIKLHGRSHTHGVAGDGTALAPTSLDVTAGPVGFSGDMSPSQITGDQNNYDPAGLATAAVLRLSTDASRTITGLAGGADGRLLLLVNVGAQDLVLADESASSTAANRFALDGALTLGADTGATLLYDGTSGRWRLVAVGKAAGGATSITNGGGTVAVNGSGAVTITPNAGQAATLAAGQLLIPNGSVTAPAIAFASDTDTGLFLQDSNTMQLGLFGVQVGMRINTSGVVQAGGSTAGFGLGGLLSSIDTLVQRSGAGSIEIGPGATANGQFVGVRLLAELTTIAAAATTDTTIQIPAHAVVLGVSVRVTTAIPTAATFDVGVAGATTRYGTGLAVAAGTTHPGTNTPMAYYAAAAAVRITPNLTPGANTGRVRVSIHYLTITPPTS